MVIDKELYPFQGAYHHINGLKYHYLDEGQGETVVMVHGNPTWSFYYRELVKHLRGNHRVIVPDHMGCGLSDKPDDSKYSYTLKSRVDDLENLLDHLGLTEDITLVVHDWGGMIGMAYASRYPQRIKRLVITNTAGFGLPETKKFPPALRICRDSAFGAFLVRGFNMFCRSAAVVCAKRKPLSAEVKRAYMAPYDSWANRIAVCRFVQDIPLREGDPAWDIVQGVEKGLHRFKNTPMLICWGEQDFVFSTHFLDEWRKHFPNAEVHSYPDCGHYILEDARDEVLGLVSNFIAAHPLQPKPTPEPVT